MEAIKLPKSTSRTGVCFLVPFYAPWSSWTEEYPSCSLGGCRPAVRLGLHLLGPLGYLRNLKDCLWLGSWIPHLKSIVLNYNGHTPSSCTWTHWYLPGFYRTLSKGKNSPFSDVKARTETVFNLLSYICFQSWITLFKWHLRVQTDWLHVFLSSMRTQFPKISLIKRGALSSGEKKKSHYRHLENPKVGKIPTLIKRFIWFKDMNSTTFHNWEMWNHPVFNSFYS